MLYSAESIIIFSGGTTLAAEQYRLMEKRAGTGHERRLINGRITGCGNCVGYCRYEDHSGFLTRDLRKEHNCLGKQCRYYLGKPKKSEKVVAKYEM